MASLRDQLLKKGLVDDKQARKAAHEKRVENTQKGRDSIEAEKAAREEKARLEAEAKRAADKERELRRHAEDEKRERQVRIAQIVASGKLGGATRGPRRFYYVTRDDRVPFLDVSEEVGGRLERGLAAIAQAPDGDVTLVDADAARRVDELDPTWLRFWRPRGPAT